MVAILLVTLVAVIITGHADLLLIILPGIAIGLILIVQIAETRRALRKLVKDTTGNLDKNHASTTRTLEAQSQRLAALEDSYAPQAAYLERIDNRARKSHSKISDIAGSVGRMAPIVREIRAAHSRTAPTSGALLNQTRPLNETVPEARPSQFPITKPTAAKPTFPTVYAAVIADEFTAQAFAYEWETCNPTPDDWLASFEARRPDFLFVESAWEGNNRSWLYHFTGQSAPRPAVRSITDYCRENGIPTVFWNKEDPPHFEDFIDTAALFDYVYTTDGTLIQEYKNRLGHDRVGILPFAAQPRMHNPARVEDVLRNREIVFGGMYFRHKYPERREQLDVLLPAADKLGLDIYSRQAGGDLNYQFPEPYSRNVRGSLPYPQMLTAYHAYKVVLNVNSVTSSPTMCARRIFEATACGAAVVTQPTAAIETFFPHGLLTTVTDTEDAHAKMRALLRSDEYRDRLVHRAQRHVWETATYTHRATTLLTDLDMAPCEARQSPSFVITSNRPGNIDIAFQNVARQNVSDKQLVFLAHGFEVSRSDQDRLREQYDLPGAVFLDAPERDSLGANLNRLFATADGDVILRMDDDDYYGANYARDLIHALNFSGSQVVGKAESYIYFEESDATVLTYIGHSHRHTNFIRGATFCGWRETFEAFKFPEARTGEDSAFLSQVEKAGGSIYSADRFNFLVKRRAAKETHTWTVNDAKLFSSGEMRFVGDDPSQVDV